MSLILYPTRIGMDRENQALSTGQPMPKIAHIVVGRGVAHADPAAATALVTPCAQSVQLAITRLSDTAIQINAGIDKAGAYTMTEVGLTLADGTLYAYGPLMPPHGVHKGEDIAIELPCVLSRAHLGDLEVDWSILDVNQLAHTVKDLAMAAFASDAAPIVSDYVSPLEYAIRRSWEYGAQHFEMELFRPHFSLRDSEPIAIRGVVAGDDSLDLAEHTDTLTHGDYVIFNASHAEPVRMLANLELGRRRLVNTLQYTYPNATLARSNWAISNDEAICQAGGVYFTRVLKLGDGPQPHRVYIRALTAAGAPELAWRDEDGEYAMVPLSDTHMLDGEWSDYVYVLPAHDRICLRVHTPAATRLRCLVVCNTLVFSASGSNCTDCMTHRELDIQQHKQRTMDYFLAQI